MNPDVDVFDQSLREIREALARIARLTEADIEAMAEELKQERWRTDPMGLMDFLDPLTLRYTLADALHSLADWIES
jgi:hypothetical protein